MRTTTRSRASLALAAVALLAELVPGTSAAPLPARAQAKVDVHQVVAGTERTFTFTVTNPLGSLGTITTVRVGASPDLVAIEAGVPLAGWTAVVDDGFVTFTASLGAGILLATSKTFRVVAEVLRPEADRDAAWSVRTATDTGLPSGLQAAAPTAPGVLGTRVRTLEVLAITPTAPAQVVGDDPLVVSTGQDNVTVEARVTNAGSADQSTTVELTGGDTTTTPATLSIAAGDTVTVPFTVAFGSTFGDSQLTATAVADGSSAVNRSIPFTAEPVVELEPEIFNPMELTPGIPRSIDARFRVSAVPWSPKVFLDQFASQIVVGDGLHVTHLHKNDATHVEIDTFCCQGVLGEDGFTLPDGLPDGPIGATVHLVGTDENGADFDVTLEYPDVRVDRRVPDGELRVELPGEAAGDDEVYRLRGSLHQEGEPCGFCVLRHSHGIDGFEVLDADGEVLDVLWVNDGDAEHPAVPGFWVAEDGDVFGVWGIEEWPVGGVSFRWITWVTDPSGLSRQLASPLYPIAHD
jgi:hypothetical protein